MRCIKSENTEHPGLTNREIIFDVHCIMISISERHGQTDGRRDDLPFAVPRIAVKTLFGCVSGSGQGYALGTKNTV